MARVLTDLPNSDTSLTWDSRVRRWAVAYRRVVVTHRALTYEAMRSPATVELAAAEGTRPLVEAIADSGVSSREANELADLIVDYVHGHALAVTDDRPRATPRAFTRSIDTIIEGIRVRAH
jgi:hypothetical protein